MIDVIELSIPVRSDLVVLARLTAATVAARVGFDVEEIEDLRLAVDELCLILVKGGTGGRLELRFTGGEDEVEIVCTLHPEEAGPEGNGKSTTQATDEPTTDLSARILDALVDEHGRDERAGLQCTWLRKRRSLAQA